MQRRARPSARRRILRSLALAVLAIAAAGSEYRGCGSTDVPDDGTPLPDSDGGCLVDADCVSDDMCVALVCVAGACVPSGAGIDADGDSYAPAPCGMDCDDSNPDLRPGAAERCDGIDDDCDGVVDEDAAGVRTLYGPEAVVDGEIVGMRDDYAVVGIMMGGDPANTLAAYVVDREGAASTPRLVGADLAPVAFDVARDGDALALALIAQPDAAPSTLTLRRSGDLWSADGAPQPIGAETGAERIATAVFAGQQWVVFDARSGGALERRLWRSGDPTTVVDVGAVPDDDAAPDIANDGARVWVNLADATLAAFDAEGAQVATQTLPGRFGHGPLASGDALVYVVYRDAFDHVMTRVTTEAFTAPIAAPAGNATDRVSIFRAGADVLATRTDDFRVTAWLLEDDLRAYRATFNEWDLGASGVAPSRLSATTTDAGVSAILSSYSDGFTPAGIAILDCESP